LRQSKLILSGEPVVQETRRWDEASGKTIRMRLKSDAVDYKYFCEPNITPIKLSDEFVDEAIKTCPELYEAKEKRYLEAGLSSSDAEIILSDIKMSAFFESGMNKVKAPKDLANFLIVEINSYLNKEEKTIDQLPITSATLADIVLMQETGGLSHKQCADILAKVLSNPQITPEKAKEELHIVAQVSDSGAIMVFVNDVLNANPQSIVDYKAGKDRALGFLVGQVMKASHGKVNPAEVSRLIKEELDKR
jgi:aspartyl-tRNA(Asn)/glutamyl-tRNA(Gln) amidotransferase subunit B